MKAYPWPGNIREIQNIVERCIILRKQNRIEPGDLHLLVDKPSVSALSPEIPDGGIALEDIEKAYIVKALEKANQNRSEAARLLKIPRHVLLYRLEKYGI